jgi:hypothetical protein
VKENPMKTRWNALLLVVGLVLALSGLAGSALGPHTAQATTTGCTISSDLFHCDVTGSNSASYGFRVTNTATSTDTRGITGIVNSSGNAYGVVGSATAASGTTAGVYGSRIRPRALVWLVLTLSLVPLVLHMEFSVPLRLAQMVSVCEVKLVVLDGGCKEVAILVFGVRVVQVVAPECMGLLVLAGALTMVAQVG